MTQHNTPQTLTQCTWTLEQTGTGHVHTISEAIIADITNAHKEGRF